MRELHPNELQRPNNLRGLPTALSLNCSLPPISESERLLAIINDSVRALGQPGSFFKLPEVQPHIQQQLQNKQLLLVEDNPVIAALYSRYLVTATNGNFNFVIHTARIQMDTLLEFVVTKQPDVVLLDYQLAAGLRGTELVAPLRRELPRSILIGFSSDPFDNQQLVAAGASGAATKRTSQIVETLEEIALVVRNKVGSDS